MMCRRNFDLRRSSWNLPQGPDGPDAQLGEHERLEVHELDEPHARFDHRHEPAGQTG